VHTVTDIHKEKKEMDIETISNEIVVAIKQLSAPFEKWDNEDKQFTDSDGMSYVRKIMLEKLLDGTFYLHIGKTGDSSESYAANMKRKAEVAYRHRDGTEISNNLIRGAAGEAQAADQKHLYLETLYADLQALYLQETGQHYVPYNSPAGYNFGTQNVVPNTSIPQDAEQMLAALGIQTDTANIVEEPKQKKKAS
tara:strand:+ start:459 stop:1043 length:585 start_codon:yes stop_codon:yes gene_type:complete